MKKTITFIVCSVFLLVSCKQQNEVADIKSKLEIKLVDSLATLNTAIFYYNLKKLSGEKIIFGHHHATAYGIGWSGDEDRSDIKDITGSHPGLIGWDFADLTDDSPVGPKQLWKLVPEAHKQGIVNIFAWHLNNIVTGNNFYDTTVVVKHILPGGTHHDQYMKELDKIAHFCKHMIGNDGKIIPIIFRPFHEFDGSWFWWGKNFCTVEEFKSLWKFTVHYLRDVRNVRNLIYAFSPDRNFYSEEEFLERYPGDDYVDILGFDDYWDFTPNGEGLDAINKKLKLVTKIAKKKNKIAAFTETGLERIPDEKWWTEKLLKVIDDDSIKISFVMVWRNAHLKHFYAPHKGHISERNFIEFKANPKIIFADELPNLLKVE